MYQSQHGSYTCISMRKQNFNKIHSLFLKIESLTSIKGHNSVDKFRKFSCAGNTAYTKFHQIPSICSQDINGNKILTSIKCHNAVEK